MIDTASQRRELTSKYMSADLCAIARGLPNASASALFQTFDLRTRALTNSIVALRLTRLAVDDLYRDLGAFLPPDEKCAPLLVYSSVEALCGDSAKKTPSILVYRLESYLEVDHNSNVGWMVDYQACSDATLESRLEALLEANGERSTKKDSESNCEGWTHDADIDSYAERVAMVQERLREDAVHGAVLSLGMSRKTHADPFDIYQACIGSNPSPYGFVLRDGDFSLIGSSPLPFLRLSNRRVRLETDAGTRPVTGSPEVDDAAAADLEINPKDAAEHQVVVDAELQSLRPLVGDAIQTVVSREVRRFSHVMHLYSAFEGELPKEMNVLDAVQFLAPAAAVSGHPKRQALLIGCDIEGGERGPYGGVIGLVRSVHEADLAVVIRSMWISNGTAHLRVGGKVVPASIAASEYREALAKSAFLVNALARAEEAS